ncbi:MAG: hypothetical protein WCG42_03265 [Parachlamydiaceae bacterium]
MKKSIHHTIFIITLCLTSQLYADPPPNGNQTSTLSPILPPTSLPFTISIEEASFSLPNGIHSGAYGIYKGKWLFLAGRTNGVHGFGSGIENFPPSQQNTVVYVVDPQTETVYSRSLHDPKSGLSQQQIDQLSVTSPQSFYTDTTLYMSGGYGIDTASNSFNTKSVLTAIDMAGLINWVVTPSSKHSAAKYIRQTSHPLLQVTGGYMNAIDPHLFTLLVFGQNFTGLYTDSSNGNYTEQVRCFQIVDNNNQLYIQPRESEAPNPNYRRRDLNVAPIIRNNKQAFVALSGVFTVDVGIWTVPVFINTDGTSSMADPISPNTFKQGMNNYVSSKVGLYSGSSKDMFIVLLGGITYEFFSNGVFDFDEEFPFTNEVTTIKIDKNDNYTQYLMDNQFPVIPSTGSNPGNTLLFGAGANFLPASGVPLYSNNVVQLDKIKKPTVIGYVVGGIMSTVPNTNFESDSTASPYIFEIILTPL